MTVRRRLLFRLARSLFAAGARVTLATHNAALRDGLLAELGSAFTASAT